MNAANLYQPVYSQHPHSPLVVRVVVGSNNQMIVGGVPAGPPKIENYVQLSSLPEELRQRVELAVQALISGG